MGFKGLLAELLVATTFDCVYLKTMRVGVNIVVLGEQVGHWVYSSNGCQEHADENFSVWYLVLS